MRKITAINKTLLNSLISAMSIIKMIHYHIKHVDTECYFKSVCRNDNEKKKNSYCDVNF